MSETIALADVYRRINAHVAAVGQAEIARRIGVTRPYVNQMVNGLKPISDALLREAGLRQRTIYEDIK
ncbi:helix-turn-helix domain-containing protein [Acidocella sp. MX-AZ02]|uniref:helix-turn-helix domain-containing protein n=1 Tax=Acidocella sp. MX-AZ02 TaxID=1214225 RepID=UPI00028DECA2|nr:transcriptional regulator [Acidocella sp. MX-AZ02]EKN01097.1 hypothetical protein MXAZACID_02289 [Acidocella sp. MX-AZ02]